MTTWEYCQSQDFGELEALGRGGWELVAVLPAPPPGTAIFYLKRARPDFRERVTEDQRRRYFGLLGIPVPEAKDRP
ncbi:MAG TPA: hypothetical protein VKY74_15935 [Chloroflexia bacterium]|nr:hypothetical protein [Chloroflexia bacterium]